MEKYKDIEVEDLLKSELKKEQNVSKPQEENKNNLKQKENSSGDKKSEKKIHKKKSNFNFEEVEKDEALNQVLYISYNHENNYIYL